MFRVAFSHGKITKDFFLPSLLCVLNFLFIKNTFIFIFIKISLFPFRKKKIETNQVLIKTPNQIFLISHIALSTYYSSMFYNSVKYHFLLNKLSNHCLICGSVYHGAVPLHKVWKSRSRPIGGPGVKQQLRYLPGSQQRPLHGQRGREALPQALAGVVLENSTGSFS